jgi:hypothetical protein
MHGRMERCWVWVSTAALALVLFVACGGGGGGGDDAGSDRSTTSRAASTTTAPPEDIDMRPADFPNVRTLTLVGNHYVGNLLGHLDEALAVANSPTGGEYPVGTIIQLVPQEAMVKRGAGWNDASNDWEFFSLDVTPEGTEILTRGATPVLNRFGLDCLSCHAQAEPQWDMVCDRDHGCDPIPLTDELILALQQADPRPTS